MLPAAGGTLQSPGMEQGARSHSHIIYIAGVGHLLHVQPRAPGCAGQHPRDGLLHQVLHIHEAPPHVAQVAEGVGSRAGVPEPGERGA